MLSKKNKKRRQYQKRYNKKIRKDLFTWLHRYLRLHNELLSDKSYQIMYDYVRATLIAYLKHDVETQECDNETIGEVVDTLADIFNKANPKSVENHKPLVIIFHDLWDGEADLMNKIRI